MCLDQGGGKERLQDIYKRCLLVNLQFGIKYGLNLDVGSDSQKKVIDFSIQYVMLQISTQGLNSLK